MFRNLEARTDNGELLNLMDSTGCPLNELIFPALALESASRALYANFKVLGVPAYRRQSGNRVILCAFDVLKKLEALCELRTNL
jgi:hypothetical protein